MTYRGDTFTGRLNAQAYQLATTTDVTPYDRLPQITFDGFLPYNPGGMQFTYGTEFVRFDEISTKDIYFNDDGSIRGKRPDASLQPGSCPSNGRPYASGAGHEFANDAQLGLCDTHIEIFCIQSTI